MKLSPTAWPRFGDGHQSRGKGRQDPGIGKLPLRSTPSEVFGCGWWEWGLGTKNGEQNKVLGALSGGYRAGGAGRGESLGEGQVFQAPHAPQALGSHWNEGINNSGNR